MRKGIILRSFLPEKRTLVILDQTEGKHICIPARRKNALVCQGMLVEYHLEAWRNTFLLSECEPVALPASWLMADIFFMHSVLQLCACCLVERQGSKKLFSLLQLLYCAKRSPTQPLLSKKFFICKLLFALGLYPSHILSTKPLFSSLISSQEDSMFNFTCNDVEEKAITAWIAESLRTVQSEALGQAHTFPFFKALDIRDETR